MQQATPSVCCQGTGGHANSMLLLLLLLLLLRCWCVIVLCDMAASNNPAVYSVVALVTSIHRDTQEHGLARAKKNVPARPSNACCSCFPTSWS
jgi:hypothetical protein